MDIFSGISTVFFSAHVKRVQFTLAALLVTRHLLKLALRGGFQLI